MKNFRNMIVAGAAATILVCTAAAQSAAGSWKGHIQFNVPNNANMNPQMKQQRQMAMAMIKSMSFSLLLKRNHTYTLDVVGGPKMNKDQQQDSGSWSQSGNTVTLNSSKKKGDHIPKFVMSGNGHTLTMQMPTGGRGSGSIIFTR